MPANDLTTKDRKTFVPPTVERNGSLRKVTATISKPPLGSDLRLKTDIAEYDDVLPRLKRLS